MLGMVSRWLFVNSKSLHPVICLCNAKSPCCPCPLLVFVRAYFGIAIALNYKYILLGSLSYNAIEPLVKLFDLFSFMV